MNFKYSRPPAERGSTKGAAHVAPSLGDEFAWRARWRSFRPAARGIVDLLRTQHNARIHSAATVAVITAGFICQLTRVEWCALIFAMLSVWSTEALNTAIEFLADEVSTEHRVLIGRAKDAGAGAVLISSLGAALIGALIFLSHLLSPWWAR